METYAFHLSIFMLRYVEIRYAGQKNFYGG